MKKRFTPPRRWSLRQVLDHYIDKSAGPDGCWPWRGYAGRGGYGRMGWKGKLRFATHLVLAEEGRPISFGKLALHTCDNPPCCNPRHLYEGDHQDNHNDMDRRGRRRIGERHPSAKLTEDDVRAIRKDNRTLVSIAADYGVTFALIGAIKRRRIWKHVRERRR